MIGRLGPGEATATAEAARGGGSPRVPAEARRTAATRRNRPATPPRGDGACRDRDGRAGPYARTQTATAVRGPRIAARTHPYRRRRNGCMRRAYHYGDLTAGTLLCSLAPPAVRVASGCPACCSILFLHVSDVTRSRPLGSKRSTSTNGVPSTYTPLATAVRRHPHVDLYPLAH